MDYKTPDQCFRFVEKVSTISKQNLNWVISVPAQLRLTCETLKSLNREMINRDKKGKTLQRAVIKGNPATRTLKKNSNCRFLFSKTILGPLKGENKKRERCYQFSKIYAIIGLSEFNYCRGANPQIYKWKAKFLKLIIRKISTVLYWFSIAVQ